MPYRLGNIVFRGQFGGEVLFYFVPYTFVIKDALVSLGFIDLGGGIR